MYNVFCDNVVVEEPPKYIIFIHGLFSNYRSDIVKRLRAELIGEVEVIAPILPPHPIEALNLVRNLCSKYRPVLIIGESSGAFYAQQVVRPEGVPSLLINPLFQISSLLESIIGKDLYKPYRKNGKYIYKITPELIDEFMLMEESQFAYYDPFNSDRVCGLFGNEYSSTHIRDTFKKYYNRDKYFDENHLNSSEGVRTELIPVIREMLGLMHPLKKRYFRDINGQYYEMDGFGIVIGTNELLVTYQELFGDRRHLCCNEQIFFSSIEHDGHTVLKFSEVRFDEYLSQKID